MFHRCHFFTGSEETLMIYTTSRNCKVSLFPRNGKNWKIRLSPQSGKNWSNFLYFSTYLTSFPQSEKHFIVAIFFHVAFHIAF